MDVEGLNAEGVTRQDELVAERIVDAEAKHPAERAQHSIQVVSTLLLVEAHDGVRVTAAAWRPTRDG